MFEPVDRPEPTHIAAGGAEHQDAIETEEPEENYTGIKFGEVAPDYDGSFSKGGNSGVDSGAGSILRITKRDLAKAVLSVVMAYVSLKCF